MDRIWNRAEDKNCANIIVYSKNNSTKAYVDKECTVQYKTSELKNAFKKGCIIIANEFDMLIPVGFSIENSTNIGHLMYLGVGSTSDSVAFKLLNSVSDDGVSKPSKV